MANPEQREFQAEVQQLLNLMVHSLYSDKDIFLRELISNASDALDKLRFEQLTNESLRSQGTSLEIRLHAEDKDGVRTLSVSDTGIGMSRDEVVTNLGTIARSGTKEFLKAVQEGDKDNIPPELIGQFGVGFYASFMVASEVEVITRRAGESEGTLWRSKGDGKFTVEEASRDECGTTVTLTLKDSNPDQGVHDYADNDVIRGIVKRYSDFVSYPIKTKVWKDKEGASGAKVLEEQTLNSMKAIWARPKNEVTEGEYREFYRHIAHDWSEPLAHIPIRVEGTIEAQALLFIPGAAPPDLYNQEMKRGVQLYVKRVFIMDECKELMPTHLRFIKGVVDAQDLSLNVSREILQKDRQIQIIRKQLVKRVFQTLSDLKKEDADKYQTFWTHFGPVMKEGLVGFETQDNDKILELIMTASTHDASKLSDLDAYISRMPVDQDTIYYLAGTHMDTLRKSPLLESFKAKGLEVVIFSDPIDEIWLDRVATYKDKKLVSIGRGEVKLGSDDEQKEAEESLGQQAAEFKDLLGAMRVHLQEELKEVRLTNRLTESPVVLVSDDETMSATMVKLMKQMGQDVPKQKRIMELNPSHPLLKKMQAMFVENKADPSLKDFSLLLHGHAILRESGQLEDSAGFSEIIERVMLRG